MNNLLQDVRFAVRMLVKRPGYAGALILVLALGIGGTSIIFTIVNGVLLEPLPYKDAGRLVFTPGMTIEAGTDPLAWWTQAKSFDALATYRSGGANIGTGARPERIPCAVVSNGFFQVFQVEASIGRVFRKEEIASDQGPTVVLSYGLWMRTFGSDKSIIGRQIALNEKSYTVIGITPPGFGFPGHTAAWVSLAQDWKEDLDLGSDVQLDAGSTFATIGRLREGATVEQARAELKTLLQVQDEVMRRKQSNYGGGGLIGVISMKESLVRESRTGLWILLGAVGFLLAIACVNVAHMLLVRAAARQKEIVVRLCMGASRGRILWQLLTESTLVALLGGTMGIVVSYWGLRAVQAFGPKDLPRLADVRLDWGALGFALGLSLLIGILVGLAPALQTMAQDLTRTLKQESSRSAGAISKGMRGAMIVVEVALTLVLLMGAGVMIRSLDKLLRTDPGFNTRNVITMDFALPESTYSPPASYAAVGSPRAVRVTEFYQLLSDSISSLPGVLSVGQTSVLPLGGKGGGGLYISGGKCKNVFHELDVASDYFHAMSIPILEGHVFSPQDTTDPKYGIVISKAMAQSCWPGASALRQLVTIQGGGLDGTRQVIGVVGDVKFKGLGDEDSHGLRANIAPGSVYYLPRQPLNATLVVRTATEPNFLVPAIRERVKKLDPEVPLFNVRTMNEVVADSTATPRFRGVALGIFAGLALILALFGLYSVVAYSVTCRTHELGVRMVLGAQPRDILWMVMREGMWLGLAGILLGTIGSYWTNKLIAGLLYGVSPFDPPTYVLAALVIILGTLAACLLPAWRAGQTDPSSALRYE